MDIDGNVGDGDIFGFIRVMRNYDVLVIGIGVFGGLDGFGKGIDLVDFEEKGVGSFEFNGFFDVERVGDG